MTSRLKSVMLFLLLVFCSISIFAQTFSSSNLPIITINTGGQTIPDDPKIIADMGIIWNGEGKRNSLTDTKNNYNGKIAIELRGSSSQMFPKKGYGFETRGSDLADLDVSLLGMPAENDWVLYAPYTDKSLIRDVFTYTIDASLGHWSPRCRYVELFLNGSYQGVYVLIEKIKRDKNRVDIAKMTVNDVSGEDLTGGYIIKIDKTTGGSGAGWYSSYSNTVGKTLYQYDYPKDSEITSLQKSYIQTYVRMMENALYTENFIYPGNYHEYLNDSSFIDFMIINELAKNVDGYRLSSYLYKGKNDRLNCGPIWDFNLTYGNANYYDGWLPTGFQYKAYLGNDGWQNPFWWGKLMKDPAYVTRLQDRWATLRQKELSNERITFVIDSLTNLISEAKDRNYERWTGVIGNYIWPNYFVGRTYDEEISWMKSWITQRLAFLDGEWPGKITNTDKLLATNKCAVYPNPFGDELTIYFNSAIEGDIGIDVYSINGLLLKSFQSVVQSGNLRLDFSGNNRISQGIYLLKVKQNNRILSTMKVIKMK